MTKSAIGLKVSSITAGIKKYKLIIKKHHKTVLLLKSKLSSIEVLISKALIDPNISHDIMIWKNELITSKRHNLIKILIYLQAMLS